MILLDTCVISETVRPRPDRNVVAWLSRRRADALYLSVLTVGELRRGVAALAPGRRSDELSAWLDRLCEDYADRVLPVGVAVAHRWGEVTAGTAAQGRAVGAVDGLIAATALERAFAVATRNRSDFEPTGVRIVDPWSDRN